MYLDHMWPISIILRPNQPVNQLTSVDNLLFGHRIYLNLRKFLSDFSVSIYLCVSLSIPQFRMHRTFEYSEQ